MEVPLEPAQSASATSRTPAARAPRRRLRLVVLLLALLSGPLLAEGVLRFLIFHPSALAKRLGQSYRDASLYADGDLDEEYWRLRRMLEGNPAQRNSKHLDSRLGWVNGWIEPESYVHDHEATLAGRQPILMYGASFAQCMPKDEHCFEGLLDASDMGATHGLLNFGVGGHGVDQVYILMRETLGRFASQRPTVVVLLVLETDFERVSMGFRKDPKPHMRLVGGELQDGDPVFAEGGHAFLQQHGTGIRSYAWNYFLGNATFVPESWRATWGGRTQRLVEQRELIEAILLSIQAELESRDLPYFFLLCSGRGAMIRPRPDPQVQALLEFFDGAGLPYVDSRRDMREVSLGSYKDYFHMQAPSLNHPNAQGTRVLFDALLQGLSGRRDGP